MPITNSDRALEILDDPGFEVVVAPDEGGAMSRLRRSVCRFAEGEAHARRRAHVERELDGLDPEVLRTEARRRAAAARPGAVAREVPTGVLLDALDSRDPDVTAAVAAARVYLRGEDDVATRRLLACWPHVTPDVGIARATIVLQSGEATAALIEAALDDGRGLARVLAEAPPVLVLRRRAPATQDAVEIDVTAIQRAGGPELTFGAGRRPCPGREHALALATGVLEGVQG